MPQAAWHGELSSVSSWFIGRRPAVPGSGPGGTPARPARVRARSQAGALRRREQHVRLAVREGAACCADPIRLDAEPLEEGREMIPQCLDMGVGVLPWSPLARRAVGGEPNLLRRAVDDFPGPIRSSTRSIGRISTSRSSGASEKSRPSAASRRHRSRSPGFCTSPASQRRSWEQRRSNTWRTHSRPRRSR